MPIFLHIPQRAWIKFWVLLNLEMGEPCRAHLFIELSFWLVHDAAPKICASTTWGSEADVEKMTVYLRCLELLHMYAVQTSAPGVSWRDGTVSHHGILWSQCLKLKVPQFLVTAHMKFVIVRHASTQNPPQMQTLQPCRGRQCTALRADLGLESVWERLSACWGTYSLIFSCEITFEPQLTRPDTELLGILNSLVVLRQPPRFSAWCWVFMALLLAVGSWPGSALHWNAWGNPVVPQMRRECCSRSQGHVCQRWCGCEGVPLKWLSFGSAFFHQHSAVGSDVKVRDWQPWQPWQPW